MADILNYYSNIYDFSKQPFLGVLVCGQFKWYIRVDNISTREGIQKLLQKYQYKDIYVTSCTYKSPRKTCKLENLFSCQTLAVDVDYRKIDCYKQYTPIQMINEVLIYIWKRIIFQYVISLNIQIRYD